MRHLTFGGRNRFPVWSPDGRRLAFQSNRDGTPSIYVQNADGGGAASASPRPPRGGRTPRFVVARWTHAPLLGAKGDTFSLMALAIGEQRAVTFGGVQSLQPVDAVFSPDGRWVAYASSPVAGGLLSADRGIFVQPFPATGATFQVPKTGLIFISPGRPSGRDIFYVPNISVADLTAVSVQILPSLTFGPPAPVAGVPSPLSPHTRPGILCPARMEASSPCCRPQRVSGTAGSEMRVILNWFEELKRLVPR